MDDLFIYVLMMTGFLTMLVISELVVLFFFHVIQPFYRYLINRRKKFKEMAINV